MSLALTPLCAALVAVSVLILLLVVTVHCRRRLCSRHDESANDCNALLLGKHTPNFQKNSLALASQPYGGLPLNDVQRISTWLLEVQHASRSDANTVEATAEYLDPFNGCLKDTENTASKSPEQFFLNVSQDMPIEGSASDYALYSPRVSALERPQDPLFEHVDPMSR